MRLLRKPLTVICFVDINSELALKKTPWRPAYFYSQSEFPKHRPVDDQVGEESLESSDQEPTAIHLEADRASSHSPDVSTDSEENKACHNHAPSCELRRIPNTEGGEEMGTSSFFNRHSSFCVLQRLNVELPFHLVAGGSRKRPLLPMGVTNRDRLRPKIHRRSE